MSPLAVRQRPLPEWKPAPSAPTLVAPSPDGGQRPGVRLARLMRGPRGSFDTPGARTLSRLLLLAAVTVLGQFCGEAASLAAGRLEAAPRQPNLVLLIADDLGYGELSCQGNPQIPTPHIDSLARDGLRFTQGYVAAAYCSMSRAGLFTGRYPTRFGYEFNPIGHQNEDPEAGLPADELTLPEVLRRQGYATGLIGKWHLGGAAQYYPLRHGFDEFFGFTHEGHFYVPPPYRGVTTMLRRRVLPGGGQGRWTRFDQRLILSTHMGSDEPAYDANNPIVRGGQPVEERQHLTDAFTREAVDFIGRHRDRPFFLCVAYNAVHSPLQADDRYLKEFRPIADVHRRIFAAMLAHLDASVGAVLASLQEHGLQEQTLIVFLSDNGGPTRELTSSNLPLRGGKGDLYEGGIRVPFLIRWKGQLAGGRTIAEPVTALDLWPTFLAAAGGALPRAARLDGVNLLPRLRGPLAEAGAEPPAGELRPLFWRVGNKAAMRYGDWKIVRNARDQAAAWELFHLAQDQAETRNLAEQQPQRVADLARRWNALNRQMVPPRWYPNRRPPQVP